MNLEQIRSLFPVTKETLYLNSASQSPLNTLVNDKLQAHLATQLNPALKNDYHRENTRNLLSKILGGLPTDYALVTSTGVGIGIVSQGLNLKNGDNIVIPEGEHWNNTFPWMHLNKKGVEIRFAKINEDNSIDPKEIEKLVDCNTRLVSIAAVRFNSGFRPNLAGIGEIARKNHALFMVDAAQGAGMIPIDVEKEGIDIMAGCGFKWLLGMHGTGYLYVNQKAQEMIEPVLPGMYAALNQYDKLLYYSDARKYETGTISYSLFDAWSAGLEFLQEIGVEKVYAKALENTDMLISGLRSKGYQLLTPTKLREERTAIVHFNTGNHETTKELYMKLIANKVLLTLQGNNLRLSPNFFNTRDEIDYFLDLV